MKKIAVIGSGGSGKSTFSRKLGKKLSIEVFHLDAVLWKPDWEAVTKEQQKIIQHQLIAKSQWIIDGNYNGTLDIRLRAADCIIFMDLPRSLCLYRVLLRMVRYRNKQRPDMATGCEEHFNFSFLKWVWMYPIDKRPGVLKKLEQYHGKKEIIILKSPKEAQQFLENIKSESTVTIP
ncbi:DNA topology modulation protein [Planococcus shenhongbingii]|uniref:DNA topology modulation protein n=1 Tax=Planococcus shenhongbingii TaxID=3058398 RepID=UPI00260A10CF|nr:DNA topology modulation protein [Planococcus sp. N016]WKA60105.1 DNA topology modulation protein [Planococcus sp. N016]